MEEMVINFFTNYGWQLALCAISGILVLGILKFFNVFKKVEASKQKYAYAGVSSIFSIAAAAVYLVLTNSFVWTSFGITASAIFTFNQTMYSIYENTGLRSLVQKLGNAIVNAVAKNKVTAAEEAYLKSIGEDIIDSEEEAATETATVVATDDTNATVNNG